MKKHNEGYTLPFVLVVFLIISLVATSILTISLQNLQSQKASIQRMEEQYAAQGVMESKIADMKHALGNTTIDVGRFVTLEGAQEKVEQLADCELYWVESYSCQVSLSAEHGGFLVECRLLFKNVISVSRIDDKDSFEIAEPEVTFLDYTITPVENGGGTT